MPAATRRQRFRRSTPGPFALTARDVEIIKTVAHHHLVRSTHLDALFPEDSPDGLRRRLRVLFDAAYLSRPPRQLERYRPGGGSQPMVYCLGNKGIAELVERYGYRRSKVDWTAKARTYQRGTLEHTLEVTDFMVALEAACRRRGHLRVLYLDDLLQALAPEATRRSPQPDLWPVTVLWHGVPEKLHVRPDKIFAIEDRNRPEGRNRKFFFLEADRGTMPAVRATLRGTSFLRKLLGYGHTYDQKLHTGRFGMGNMRLLTVAHGGQRIDSLIATHRAHTWSLCSPKLFLFASRAALFNGADILDASWTAADREQTTLLA